MKIRHRGKITEAYQWWRNGDHPDDHCEVHRGTNGLDFWGEGKVVRYYRHPDVPGHTICEECGFQMHLHGWIEESFPDEDREEHHLWVCPGDWIVKEDNNYKVYRKGFFSEVDDLDKR